MKAVKSLESLRENVSEECYEEVMNNLEGLFVNDGRGDLFDDISKALTGKTLKQHVAGKTKKVVDKIGDAILNKLNKTSLVKNTVGKNKVKKASQDLDRAVLDYNFARDSHRASDDPSQKRVLKHDMNKYNKIANKKAKVVSDLKDKYGIK